MKRTLAPALILACAALTAAGCGSSSNNGNSTTQAATPNQTTQTSTSTAPTPTSGGGSSLKLSADPSGGLKFDTTSLSGKAGKVTLVMNNPSPVPHAIAVEGNGVDQKGSTVQSGGKSTVSVTLKPGTYTFYCPVDGHKAAGMKGTLTVK